MGIYRDNKKVVALFLLIFMLISIGSMCGIKIYIENNNSNTQSLLPQNNTGFYFISFSLYSLAVEVEEGNNPAKYKFQRRFNPPLRQSMQGDLINNKLEGIDKNGFACIFINYNLVIENNLNDRIIKFIHEKDGKKDKLFAWNYTIIKGGKLLEK